MSYISEHATVVPSGVFSAVADAAELQRAMKGKFTDEATIFKIICQRTNEQRQHINKAYKTQFGIDLIEDIRSETKGSFEKLMVALLTETFHFYVKELYDAMAGIGTDEDVLIEVLCTMSNKEIHVTKNAYAKQYGKSLEDELISETSNYFRRLMVAVCAGGRDESGVVNLDAAARDAVELLRAGELKAGTNESIFTMILCERNFAQIKLISEEYQKLTGHGLDVAIKNEFDGDIKDGLLAILQCAMDRSQFFAKQFYNSLVVSGVKDKALIRLVVTRCEIDLKDIKRVYECSYGKSLLSCMKVDTTGHYWEALYELIGEEYSSKK